MIYKMNENCPLECSELYRLSDREKLAQFLELPPHFFESEITFSYRERLKPKSNGKDFRKLTIPEGKLQRIQRIICDLLMIIETPDWLVSGKKHLNYISNAEKHKDASFVLTMDISKFFDSAQEEYILQMFENKFLIVPDLAEILARLVMYKGKLPTGGPSSQAVAFWAYQEMFKEIKELADKYDCRFSLYVDDMAFSSMRPIPKRLRIEVTKELKKYGLKAKSTKTHYYKRHDIKIVTGVAFKNGKAYVPNKRRREILDQFRKCKSTRNSSDVKKLEGMLNAARQIEPNIFPEIKGFIVYFKSTL